MASVQVQMADNASNLSIFVASSANSSTDGDSSYISVEGGDFPVQYLIGRRFQAFKSSYRMPCDDKECQREYYMHFGLKEFFNDQLYLAPVMDPKRILDIGCGFGFFAEEIAQRNPEIEVTGVDIIPRDHEFIPDNLRHYQADVEASSEDGGTQPAWSHPRLQDADLVFFRDWSVSLVDPLRVMENAKRTLKPGGWVEFQQITSSKVVERGPSHPPPNSAADRWENTLESAYAKVCPQSDFYIAGKLKSMLEEAGFVNVQERIFMLPVGDWPKKRRLRNAGVCIREACLGVKDMYEVLVQHAQIMTNEEFQELYEDFRAEVFDRNMHICAPYSVVFGQKPLE